MSDDDDTSQATASAAPAASKGWSEQDRRTLVITVVGGLAANVATVILVGGALALVHYSRTQGSNYSGLLTGTLITMACGLGAIAIGNAIRRWGGRRRILRVLGLSYGWFVITAGCLFALVGVMILIGLASGVK